MNSKFNSILLESVSENRIDTTILDENETIKLLKNNCKDFKFTHKPIWRNVENLNQSYYLIDPLKYTRKSIDTSNYYTLILDNTSSFSKFPKRSNCLIGMYDGYNHVYGKFRFRVIPFDGAKFGVCPTYDMWYSFKNIFAVLKMNIKDINTLINDLTYFYKITPPNDDNYELMVRDINNLELLMKKTLQNISSDQELKFFLVRNISAAEYIFNIYKIIKNGGHIIESIEKYINPKDNNVELLSYVDLANKSNISNRREVWTDSKCVLIYHENVMNIKSKI